MKWLRNILKGATLSTALFIFQACYGTPQDAWYNEGGLAPMSFSLVSRTTGQPLEGISILASEHGTPEREIGVTDANGKCQVEIPYIRNIEGPSLRFSDPSGVYQPIDTTLTDLRNRDILIELTAAE